MFRSWNMGPKNSRTGVSCMISGTWPTLSLGSAWPMLCMTRPGRPTLAPLYDCTIGLCTPSRSPPLSSLFCVADFDSYERRSETRPNKRFRIIGHRCLLNYSISWIDCWRSVTLNSAWARPVQRREPVIQSKMFWDICVIKASWTEWRNNILLLGRIVGPRTV